MSPLTVPWCHVTYVNTYVQGGYTLQRRYQPPAAPRAQSHTHAHKASDAVLLLPRTPARALKGSPAGKGHPLACSCACMQNQAREARAPWYTVLSTCYDMICVHSVARGCFTRGCFTTHSVACVGDVVCIPHVKSNASADLCEQAVVVVAYRETAVSPSCTCVCVQVQDLWEVEPPKGC
jgi:hypothetical protein